VEQTLQRQAERFAIAADDDESRLYRKVILRIIPFIFICYVSELHRSRQCQLRQIAVSE
jgi:hypothetical protein